MQKDYPVHAYLQGKEKQKFLGTVEAFDEPVKPFSFITDTEVYRTYIHESAFAHNHIVLFDGLFLPHGLPSGAKQLLYEYGRKEDKFHLLSQKKILVIADSAMVIGSKELMLGPQSSNLPERELHHSQEKIQITLYRHLLLLPKGHTALGFRMRPRSLERQYTCMESSVDDVIFRTIVR